MKRTVLSCYLLLPICFILFASPLFASTQILNVRHWTAPDNTRIVIDTDGEARYSLEEEPGRLIVDVSDAEIQAAVSTEYRLDAPAVSHVRVIPLPGDTARVEVALQQDAVTSVFTLGRILDKPHRIVIDVKLPDVERRESEERKRIGIEEKKRIIVLDPGHGGEDPGAVGRLGTREKDVVLDISRRLRDLLNERGYQVFLTREGDYYVSLMRRGQIARQYNADLFISIHADAAPVRSARGSSVYCLSTIGASNEAARLLAASQNLSDILGGDPGSGASEEADPIILSMLQTETLNQSRSFGAVTLETLGRVNELKFVSVQGAPFRVLKLPDITSILVETAYISNPHEERLLRSSAFRDDVAWAIAAAVTRYLPNQQASRFMELDARYEPRSRSMVLAREDTVYTVRRGDRLERIAADHGTTVRELMAINNIRSRDRIFVGQRLTIPGDYMVDDPVPAAPAVYTVEAGDTLERVARRYGVSMADLARVNSIESRDRIYVGQTLYLSEPPSSQPAAAATPPRTHVVVRGDTLERIAHRHGVSMNDLMRFNTIASRDRIYIGQELVLSERAPALPVSSSPRTHVVVRGETLERIARRYDVSMDDLMRFNNIESRDRIYVDQELVLSRPSPPTPTAVPGRETHVVVRGDTLERIARRYDVSMDDLMRLNNLRSRDRIYVGQRLALAGSPSETAPPLQTHVVARGETLEIIARRNGVSVNDIVRANNLPSRDMIRVGQRLQVPVHGSAGTGERPSTYIVARGDTLETIARRFETTVESLMAANDLPSRHRILVGQELTISR